MDVIPVVKYLGRKKTDTSNLLKYIPLLVVRRTNFLYKLFLNTYKSKNRGLCSNNGQHATPKEDFYCLKKSQILFCFCGFESSHDEIIAAKNTTITKLSNQCITYLLICTYFIKIIGKELLF